MVHEDVHIPLTVKSVEPETPGYLSMFFERPRGFTFEPGDWMDINLPGEQLGVGRTFSLVSSPDEPDLRITFREGVSLLKQALAAMQPGDSVVISEYGNDYGFRLNEHRSAVLIAGGIGVAPFRSMLKQMADFNGKSEVRLIYFNTAEDFLFRQDFDDWQRKLHGLDIHYVTTKELKRKDREKLLRELLPDPQRQYYVSGPSGMVNSALEVLEKFGVARKGIKVDDFGVY